MVLFSTTIFARHHRLLVGFLWCVVANQAYAQPAIIILGTLTWTVSDVADKPTAVKELSRVSGPAEITTLTLKLAATKT